MASIRPPLAKIFGWYGTHRVFAPGKIVLLEKLTSNTTKIVTSTSDDMLEEREQSGGVITELDPITVITKYIILSSIHI